MNPQPHPATEPVIRALADLAAWQPADAAELARILAGVHTHGRESILTVLDAALGNLAVAAFGIDGATAQQSRLISQHLESAAGIISGAAIDIDKARADTGTEWTA